MEGETVREVMGTGGGQSYGPLKAVCLNSGKLGDCGRVLNRGGL